MDWLIIGLGNPGEQYHWTRHNYGFLALDHLQDYYNAGDFEYNKYHRADLTNFRLNTIKVGLLKPQTFMNKSGESLIKLKEQVDPEKIIIIYDDVDLPFGNLRIRNKGSAGTHNGLKSIIQSLGTPNFPRIRCGIKPDHRINSMSQFVLAPFNSKERQTLEELFVDIRQAAELILEGRPQEAAQKYNKKC